MSLALSRPQVQEFSQAVVTDGRDQVKNSLLYIYVILPLYFTLLPGLL